jgi:hypothetical protein
MPRFDWQLIVALLAVAGAAWFLFRRMFKTLQTGKKTDSTCGSCGSCATRSNPATTPHSTFVPLETLTRDKAREPQMDANQRNQQA